MSQRLEKNCWERRIPFLKLPVLSEACEEDRAERRIPMMTQELSEAQNPATFASPVTSPHLIASDLIVTAAPLLKRSFRRGRRTHYHNADMKRGEVTLRQHAADELHDLNGVTSLTAKHPNKALMLWVK